MDIELSNLPIIDQELNLRLAGNNKQLAKEILSMLATSMPNELANINRHFKNNHYHNLLADAHKLHGAIAFCGLPRLKAVLHQLEASLKANNLDTIPALMKTLNEEAERVLEQCPHTAPD